MSVTLVQGKRVVASLAAPVGEVEAASSRKPVWGLPQRHPYGVTPTGRGLCWAGHDGDSDLVKYFLCAKCWVTKYSPVPQCVESHLCLRVWNAVADRFK